MIEQIKEDVEKISVLAELCEDLVNKGSNSAYGEHETKLRIDVAKDQILKSTYNIKRILTKIENRL